MEVHNILTPGPLFDNLTKSKKSFVKFYHDQCGHCNAMLPAWKRLEDTFKKNKKHNGHIISVHHDAIQGIQSSVKNFVNGYPTLLEVLPGGVKGQEFSGERSFAKLHEFASNIFGNNLQKAGGKSKRKSTKKGKGTNKRKSTKKGKGTRKDQCIKKSKRRSMIHREGNKLLTRRGRRR